MKDLKSTQQAVSLMWFRNDLRITDNSALWNAAKSGQVVGLFTVTAKQWQRHDMAQIKIDFIRRHLTELSQQLAKLNIPLLVRNCPDYGSSVNEVLKVAKSIGATEVFWNREYLLNEVSRDNNCTSELTKAGFKVNSYSDASIVPPGQVVSGSGEMYKVFTPFFRNWHEQVKSFPVEIFPAPQKQTQLAIEPDPVNAYFEGIDSRDSLHWPAGEEAALDRLSSFVGAGGAASYKEYRDIPEVKGTSELSPYLSIGAISARQCLYEATKTEHADAWIRQLAWRDFYIHLTYNHPKISRGEPFQAKTKSIRWRECEHNFQAWSEGSTGQPFVDAGMRQLKEIGWMHNRLRMVTAMFLTKNLFLDWHLGEKHFLQNLIDGDYALNNGGWQWSASTGTDAVPYFRVFNPFSQSKRFDPDGSFIKRYVPELSDLPATALHDPIKLEAQRPADYPSLIVDIKQSRADAIREFSELQA